MTRSEHDRRIAEMFYRVAPRYDQLTRVLSAGRDIGGRRRAVALARLDAHQVALDLGVGTGDLAFGLLAASENSARVIGVDLSPAMLEALRRRADASAERRVMPLLATAERLPFADPSLDRVLAGLAARTFGHRAVGLRERPRRR